MDFNFKNEEEKIQTALNMLNRYNLLEAIKNGKKETWENLTELPEGMIADTILDCMRPVYPKGHMANI